MSVEAQLAVIERDIVDLRDRAQRTEAGAARIEGVVIRIEEAMKLRAERCDDEDAERIPSRLAALEATVAGEVRDKKPPQWLMALIGAPDGYMRSKAFMAFVLSGMMAAGWVTADQAVRYVAATATLVPQAPIPYAPAPASSEELNATP